MSESLNMSKLFVNVELVEGAVVASACFAQIENDKKACLSHG